MVSYSQPKGIFQYGAILDSNHGNCSKNVDQSYFDNALIQNPDDALNQNQKLFFRTFPQALNIFICVYRARSSGTAEIHYWNLVVKICDQTIYCWHWGSISCLKALRIVTLGEKNPRLFTFVCKIRPVRYFILYSISLRIILDQRLNMDNHLRRIIQNIYMAFWIYQKICKRSSFLHWPLRFSSTTAMFICCQN